MNQSISRSSKHMVTTYFNKRTGISYHVWGLGVWPTLRVAGQTGQTDDPPRVDSRSKSPTDHWCSPLSPLGWAIICLFDIVNIITISLTYTTDSFPYSCKITSTCPIHVCLKSLPKSNNTNSQKLGEFLELFHLGSGSRRFSTNTKPVSNDCLVLLKCLKTRVPTKNIICFQKLIWSS